MGRFDGKVAVITGASRGIGLAVAQRLVDDGAKVVITARKEPALTEAVHALGEDRAAFVAGSADDESHQDETIATGVDRVGGLDFPGNKTGSKPGHGPIKDMEAGAANKTMGLNVVAAIGWAPNAHHDR